MNYFLSQKILILGSLKMYSIEYTSSLRILEPKWSNHSSLHRVLLYSSSPLQNGSVKPSLKMQVFSNPCGYMWSKMIKVVTSEWCEVPTIKWGGWWWEMVWATQGWRKWLAERHWRGHNKQMKMRGRDVSQLLIEMGALQVEKKTNNKKEKIVTGKMFWAFNFCKPIFYIIDYQY